MLDYIYKLFIFTTNPNRATDKQMDALTQKEEFDEDFVMVPPVHSPAPPASLTPICTPGLGLASLKARNCYREWLPVKPFDQHGWGFIEKDLSLRYKKVL
jgi:hypothetical protein